MDLYTGARIFSVLMLVGLVIWGVEKLRDWWAFTYTTAITPAIWKCHRSQGGGVVETPHPMSQSEATVWCAQNLGPIMYVDPEHYFIFYRA